MLVRALAFGAVLCTAALQSVPVSADYAAVPQTIVIAGRHGPPEKLRAGNQVYDFDLSGIEEYMEQLERRDRDTYRAVERDYEKLMAAESSGLTWALVTGGAGLALAIAGGVLMGNDDITGLYLFGIGLTVGTLGAWAVYGAISPGRDDMRRFVNRVNEARPEHPLELYSGKPLDRRLTLGLVRRF